MSPSKTVYIGSVFGMAAAIFSLMSLDRARAADCVMQNWTVRDIGPDALDLHWKVKKGALCKSFVTATRGGAARVLSNFIVTLKASHGAAVAQNTLNDPGWSYKASSNFAGSDHFQITCDRRQRWSTDPAHTTFDVYVDVIE